MTPPGKARQWQLAAAEPIHEVLVSANLFETGMGALCVAGGYDYLVQSGHSTIDLK